MAKNLRKQQWPLVTWFVLASAPQPAYGNGRFPQAQHVVLGPGRRDEFIALRTTFGLIVSDDGGQRFRFLCEEAFEYQDGFDPTLTFTSVGALLVGLRDGMTTTRDLCAPTRVRDVEGQYVVDVTTDPSARIVLASVLSRDAVPVLRFARSDDSGARFELTRDGMPGAVPLTVDLAPSDPQRAYATVRVEGVTVLLRSRDGARTWQRTRGLRIDEAAYLGAVHPMRPEVLFVRTTVSGTFDGGPSGGTLLRSDDGGDTFREVARTVGPMRGLAISGDGTRVWIGGPDARDGLQLSTHDGAFTRVSDAPVECLRWHAGALYLCETLSARGVLLSRATGDGSVRDTILRLDAVLPPPPACAPGTIVRDFCGDRWNAVRAMVNTQLRDGATTRPDVLTLTDTGDPQVPTPSCDPCSTRPRGTTSLHPLVCFALALRRRRALPSPPRCSKKHSPA
jgi:hypothetical protein